MKRVQGKVMVEKVTLKEILRIAKLEILSELPRSKIEMHLLDYPEGSAGNLQLHRLKPQTCLGKSHTLCKYHFNHF